MFGLISAQLCQRPTRYWGYERRRAPHDAGHAELATTFEAVIDLIRGLTENKHILGNAGLVGTFAN